MERKIIGTDRYTAVVPGRKCVRRTFLVLSVSWIILILCLSGFNVVNAAAGGSRAPTKLTMPEGVQAGNFNYVTLADVNKDDNLDIIAGAGGYPGRDPGGLYVLLNNDGKSFSDASSGLPGKGMNYFGLVQVIDINKDSNLDIIASYESQWSGGEPKGIGIWLGNGGSGGSMKWTAASSPVSEGSYDSAYCADINGDGQLDIVGGSSKGLHAWQGSHSGSSLSWVSVSEGLPTSNEFTGVTLGDINNDGRLDIVAGSYSSRGISVYMCSSAGTISWSEGNSETNLKKSGNTFDNRLVDLNQDSKLDLVSTIRGGILAYLGNGNTGDRESWWTEVSTGLPTSGDYYEIAIGDVNGDDKLDICSNFEVWSNSGSMTDAGSYSWEQVELGAEISKPVGTAIGDLNNDDSLDIIGCGWGSGVNAYTLTLGSSDPPKYHFIRGTVKSQKDGSALAGATVVTDSGGYTTTTDNSGNYELNVLDSTYHVTVSLEGYKEAMKVAEVNNGDVTLNFQLVKISELPEQEFALSGTLTDTSTGEPIAGVKVTIEPGGKSTTTDAQGKYSLPVTNGSYILSFSSPDHQSDSINVEVNGNSIVKDFTLVSTEPPDDEEKEKKETGLPFMELPLMVLAFVFVIIILLGRMKIRRLR
ncbi:FG-GAP-like repeat-containing protein [[Eubacterium] cellulosolvens]